MGNDKESARERVTKNKDRIREKEMKRTSEVLEETVWPIKTCVNVFMCLTISTVCTEGEMD